MKGKRGKEPERTGEDGVWKQINLEREEMENKGKGERNEKTGKIEFRSRKCQKGRKIRKRNKKTGKTEFGSRKQQKGREDECNIMGEDKGGDKKVHMLTGQM